MSDIITRSLLVALCLTVAGAARAETSSIYACGTDQPTLNFCRREIKRINAEMKRLNDYYLRTGKNPGGMSFTNCAVDCIDTHPSLKDKLK